MGNACYSAAHWSYVAMENLLIASALALPVASLSSYCGQYTHTIHSVEGYLTIMQIHIHMCIHTMHTESTYTSEIHIRTCTLTYLLTCTHYTLQTYCV